MALHCNGLSAHAPDLPGCVAAGKTRDETLQVVQKAIELHLRAMSEDGVSIPQTVSGGVSRSRVRTSPAVSRRSRFISAFCNTSEIHKLANIFVGFEHIIKVRDIIKAMEI
jgi:predicted RNase H-like HicB family nuclease